MKKKDIVFVCSKCEHNLFVTKGMEMTGKQLVRKVVNKNCPDCGEEAGSHWAGLWRITCSGNFEEEHE